MTKENLLAYKNIRKELKSIEHQIEQLKTDARSVRGVRYTDSPRGRGEPVPAHQRYMERLEELSALYEDKKAQLVESQIAIERAITSLPLELRTLMRYRYIDGLEWFKINTKLNISRDTSMRWHRKALEKISTS